MGIMGHDLLIFRAVIRGADEVTLDDEVFFSFFFSPYMAESLLLYINKVKDVKRK